MTPDLPTASGGVQVIYRMAHSLRAMGIPARVWHGTAGHQYPGLGISADVVYDRRRTLHPGDVLVVTEVGGPKWSFIAGDAPVVVLNQGHDYTFQHTSFTQDLPDPYPGWPTARAAIATSRLIEDFLQYATPDAFPVHRVPAVVDAELFAPRVKERVLALMPRRRTADLTGVVQLLRRRGLLHGWELVLIDGMSLADVAGQLGRAAVFLHGGEYEGFGLPGAEALAAGCYLVGFTGAGGREFMSPQWCSPIYDENVLECAQAVEAAMVAFDHNPSALSDRVRLGREHVLSQYSPQVMALALREAFTALMAPGSPAVLSASTEVPHYSAFSPPTALVPRAVIGARTLAGRVRHRGRAR